VLTVSARPVPAIRDRLIRDVRQNRWPARGRVKRFIKVNPMEEERAYVLELQAGRILRVSFQTRY
jgi:hypothetical protein